MSVTFAASVLAIILCLSCSYPDTQDNYENNIIFYGFNSSISEHFVSTFNTSISEQGCDPSGNFSIIVHGWLEGIGTTWAGLTVSNLLKYRGGCVFFMDYSRYANVSRYLALTPHFQGISSVLLKKVKQIGNYDQLYVFGFSFGSRLAIDVGLKLGNQSISRMDICDPAGPGFRESIDPKPAAKNVACINTSWDKGTRNYNCHQNFRMGVCGYSQPGAGSFPLGSHGLCPYLYNLAFTYDFVPNNYFKCSSWRMAQNLTSDVKMGYRGNFNRSLVVGDIFVATSKLPPYTMNENGIDNQLDNLMQFQPGYQLNSCQV